MQNSADQKLGDREQRKDYWNDNYRRYWEARVKEANESPAPVSALIEGDTLTTTDKNYFTAIELLNIKEGAQVLEMGCGFGRSIPYLYSKTKRLFAIDISQAMIDAARESCKDLDGVEFRVSEAEQTPFESGKFDYLICYAVFDALYQKDALIEMNRITKSGASLLLTGKNDNYFDDDQEALVAERNARRKGHPNFFTDVSGLLAHLGDFGFALKEQRYFPRRGDDNQERFVTEMPELFYEYMIVLTKCGNAKKGIEVDIANQYSKTFKRQDYYKD